MANLIFGIQTDTIDVTHQIGIAIIFLIFIFAIVLFLNLRESIVKKRKDVKNKMKLFFRIGGIFLIIVVGILILISTDGPVEIIAAIIVIISAFLLAKNVLNPCQHLEPIS